MSIQIKLPAYVDRFVDRYGHARFYFRRKGGPRFPLPGLPYSVEFMAAYAAALEGQATARGAGSDRVLPGSIDELIADYYGSDQWLSELSDGSRKFRKAILESFREKYGAGKCRAMQRDHIQAIIAKRPASSQKNWIKTLRHLFKFAAAANRIAINPTADVILKKAAKTGGFRPWSEEDVAAYRAFYAVGTTQRLAMELMLNLGIRVSDAAQVGPRDIKAGVLVDYRPQKGRATGGLAINVPVHADLQTAIAAASVRGVKTFLVSDRGEPFKADRLSERVRDWCDAAGLPQCTAHGLRKLCLTRLAEAGCSVFEIMAISGHKNLKEVQTYVDAANRKKLAVTAMDKLKAMADA
jgi:integrase